MFAKEVGAAQTLLVKFVAADKSAIEGAQAAGATGGAMSKFPILCLLAAIMVTEAWAAQPITRVTVAQLAQLMSQARSTRDGKLARELSALDMTQRISTSRLARWQAEVRGKRAHQALTVLADASAFLDLPPADLPAGPPPSMAAQRQIFVRTVSYVHKTLSKLPNFYAVRTTTHFEEATTIPERMPMPCRTVVLYTRCRYHAWSAGSMGPSLLFAPFDLGRSRLIVTYNDGKEFTGKRWRRTTSRRERSLTLSISGEFGPILDVILHDAAHGTVVWAHWERGPSGKLAVFRYRVPAAYSHYFVYWPFPWGVRALTPAYHGEIDIDPGTGTIYRVTVVADPEPANRNAETAIMVKYGSVTIGGRAYVCPVRGVALSRKPDASRLMQPHILTEVNNIQYTRYHLFRAAVKILPDNGPYSPSSRH
jgi:hypothetical protein